jgi:hypothetical protein
MAVKTPPKAKTRPFAVGEFPDDLRIRMRDYCDKEDIRIQRFVTTAIRNELDRREASA